MVSPFNVLGTSLQLSVRSNKDFYGSESTAVSKLLIAKSYEMAVQEQRHNALTLSSGVTGANKPFRAPIYNNYREAFVAIAGQGYQGFFKGNFVSGVSYIIGMAIKTSLYSIVTPESAPPPVKFFLGFGITTLVDIASQPFRNVQTRFILQNRIPEFATYKTILNCFSKMTLKESFQGYTAVLPTAVLTTTFFTLQGTGLAMYIPFIAYLATYPISTAQRRLEAQSIHHTMLPRRYLTLGHALKTIYKEEGIVGGLYRGIICNTIAVRYT